MSKTIYKICPEALWREAEARGVLRRRADRPRRRLHPFLDRRAGARDGRQHFAGQSDLLLVAIDDAALGASAEIRALARRRAVPASLRRRSTCRRVLWVKPLPLGADGVHVFPDLTA